MNTALFDLVDKHKIDAARVRKVRIALSQAAFDMHGGFGTYKAKFEALLSAHYTAAVILHDRALTLAQFEPKRYDDPKLRAFAAEKVEVRADAAVAGSQANVDIEMDDGAMLSAHCEHPLGSRENPLSRAQIEQKFRSLCRGRAARRPYRRRDRRGRPAGGFRLGAQADGSAARAPLRAMAAAE